MHQNAISLLSIIVLFALVNGYVVSLVNILDYLLGTKIFMSIKIYFQIYLLVNAKFPSC